MIQQLINDNINGMSPIGIDTVTTPKLRGGQRNLMQGRVRKHMTGANVMLFQNKNVNGYDAIVRRRLESEGKDPDGFVLSPRKWGTRLENTPFVEHNGQYYLECIFLHSGDVSYTLDGEAINVEDIEGLDLVRTPAEQGGLNDKVVIRTFKVESITRVTINHETIEV